MEQTGIVTRAVNIEWDVDFYKDNEGNDIKLPTEMIIPAEIADDEDAISDYLSDQFGFCYEGYQLVKQAEKTAEAPSLTSEAKDSREASSALKLSVSGRCKELSVELHPSRDE